MSTTVRGAAAAGRTEAPAWSLYGIMLVGFVLRMVFINGDGFHNDVAAFESWSLTLAAHPFGDFYAKAGFADYPPGYFLVLWFVGHLYNVALHVVGADPNYGLLKILVKMPAIVMDLVDTYLIYAIVKRFASLWWALIAAAFFLLNPASIYISSYWGQIDSISGGLALAGIFALMVAPSRDARNEQTAFVLGWLALTFSLLIKPQAALLVPLFLAYAFATGDGAERRRRLSGTGLGVLAGLVFTYAVCALFHNTLNPVENFRWLLERYAYGSNVYQYNTINAFNLYAIFRPFWQSDAQPISFGSVSLGAMYMWGIVLVLAATALIIARFVQRRDTVGFLEAAMLLMFAFFTLSTRMHERYVYDAFLLCIPLMWAGKRYLYGAVILSVTLLVNLAYSLWYQTVVEQKIAGTNAFDLWPSVTHPLAALNVVLFFVLGYVFLGGAIDLPVGERSAGGKTAGGKTAPAPGGGLVAQARAAFAAGARRWYSPLEGIAAFTRADYLIAIGWSVLSFVLCAMWYYNPGEKIFDEIYYARSGEEYLKHIEQFEWTHPPVTKLVITLSIMLFGGLQHGDWSGGWRFLNVVVGALMVFVLYAFAKRLTGSTPFSAIAAGMLTFDGFHFVQSRIATPEITVAFFSLATLYAFYRYWLAAQVRQVVTVRQRYGLAFLATMGAGALVAILFSYAINRLGVTPPTFLSYAVMFLYVLAGAYLLARLLVPRFLSSMGVTTTYADGAQVVSEASSLVLISPDGGELQSTKKSAVVVGSATKAQKGDLVYEDEDLRIAYSRDGSERYETPDGVARFTADGVMSVAASALRATDARLWLVVLAAVAGLLAASKWNGLFDFFVVWFVAIAVVAQRYLRRPALYGNPFGFPFDILVTMMLFIGGTIYLLAYIPYYTLGHNIADLIGLQHQMYGYHYDLKATHPYQSVWWQWPLLQRPISYYYHDFRVGAAAQNGAKCCVAEILALPNPLVWWLGLISVPYMIFLAWKERNKGYTLLSTAYFLQWLPWMASPRIAFEYHFFPNLAVIVLANTVLLQRIWARLASGRWIVGGYLVAVFLAFWYFYPILAGVGITYDDWYQRMWSSWLHFGFNWI